MDFPVNLQGQPATIECVVSSAVRRQVPANVLLAILEWENGHDRAIPNKNGSFDFGQGGVNTVNLRDVTRQGVPADLAAYSLMKDGCYNAEYVAYLLQQRLSERRPGNPDFWNRVASYHSKTPSLNLTYQTRIRPLADKWARYLSQRYVTYDVRMNQP